MMRGEKVAACRPLALDSVSQWLTVANAWGLEVTEIGIEKRFILFIRNWRISVWRRVMEIGNLKLDISKH